MYLFLMEQGAKVSIDSGKIIVESDNLKRELPKELIESVIIFGNIKLTTSFIRHCLIKKIPVSFFSTIGEYFGKLDSYYFTNINRLKKQIILSEKFDYYFPLSQKLIDSKINNQIVVLKRYAKYSDTKCVKEIELLNRVRKSVVKCQTVDELIGFEGYCAKIYFSCLSGIVPKEFKFNGRSKRPPKDEFNSLLSLGYTLMIHEIMGQIESVDISSFCGFLHKDKAGSPSLASDLLEEWRAVIVDSVVLNLVINQKIKLEHFIRYENVDGVFLTQAGLKIFIKEFQKKLDTSTNYFEYLKHPVSFRKGIYHQCRRLAKSIEEEDYTVYEPLRIR